MQKFILLFLISAAGTGVFAHEGHDHGTSPVNSQGKTAGLTREQVEHINSQYRQSVKPFFDKKCGSCHGIQPATMPWYYSIPGVKQYIDSDIAEGLEHLDISHDFPFGGHHTLREEFHEFRKIVDDGSMPPWPYRMMHSGSALTNDEKNALIRWIDEGEKILGTAATK